MSALCNGRQLGDSISSSGSVATTTRGRGERLLVQDRPTAVVVEAFVNGTESISRSLVRAVTHKCCQLQLFYQDAAGNGVGPYYGQAGLLKGERLTPSPDNDASHRHKRSRTMVTFAGASDHKATLVTSKHNLENENGDQYLHTWVTSTFDCSLLAHFDDGGTTPQPDIEVRPATNESAYPLFWPDNDRSFSRETSQVGKFTKKPRLFDLVSSDFRLRVGHNVGIVVYRTFAITKEHAGIYSTAQVDLEATFGPPGSVCIYTGQVTEVSANGKTFCHDINTFAGCSGAVVFLLDQQPENLGHDEDDIQELKGKAVGVHVGGLDYDNNFAFLLNYTNEEEEEENDDEEKVVNSYK